MSQVVAWIKDTRGKVTLTLLVLWIGALIFRFSLTAAIFPLVAVIVTVVFDIIVTKIRFRADVFSLSSIVTGLLIGLILDPSSGVIPLLVAVFTACFTKQFVNRGPHHHIFNPAAVGLVVSLLFGGAVSWWGTTWGYGALVIIAVGMIISLHQLHRLWIPGLFLVAYAASQLTYASPQTAVILTIDGTVFLFAFVMLPEPMTSLLFGYWRYGWGVFVAGIIFAEGLLRITQVDPFLLALLIANAIGFFIVRPFVARPTPSVGSV